MLEHVIYTAEADEDVAAAYAWYEGRELGLGEKFLRCVEARVITIRRQPFAFPVAVDDFRHALIRRFPYEIFDEVTDDTIVVYSVFHCSQDPGKWQERLKRGQP